MKIIQGVNDANNELKQCHTFIPNRTVKTKTGIIVNNERYVAEAIGACFDVAITASEVEKAKGGGSIKVTQLFFGGVETSNNTEI